MPRLLFSEVDISQLLRPAAPFLLLFSGLYPPDLSRAQGVADMFVDFLTSPFTRVVAITGLAVCGLMTMVDRLPRGAA